MRVPLPPLDSTEPGAWAARPFPLPAGAVQGARQGIVVARRGARGEVRVSAFVNRCPHAGYGLDLGDGDVRDPSGRWLMCMVHGAVFRPEDGACVGGPAAGEALTSLEARLDGGEVHVSVR